MSRVIRLCYASGLATLVFQLSVFREIHDHMIGSSAVPDEFRLPQIRQDNFTHESSEETFSACLLVMDDNHKLPEWIAYHYHVLPLRHLVVAVDPRSVTFPTNIFDKWRQQGMTIEEWTDEEIGVDHKHKKESEHFDTLDAEQRLEHHRMRQRRLYGKCSKHLKNLGRSWTIYIDTDEYLVFNGPANQTNPKLTSLSYPSVQESGAVMHYLQAQMKRNNTNPYWRTPCIGIPRTLFGTKQGKTKKRKPIPQGFNASTFDTLRYSKHTTRVNAFQHTGMGKCMVDLSRVEKRFINPVAPSAHRPIPMCRKPWVRDGDTVFRINHYTGSWEAYASRQDARLNTALRAKYEFDRRAGFEDNDDDTIRPWLDGFVQEHGHERASNILRGAGVLEPKIG